MSLDVGIWVQRLLFHDLFNSIAVRLNSCELVNLDIVDGDTANGQKEGSLKQKIKNYHYSKAIGRIPCPFYVKTQTKYKTKDLTRAPHVGALIRPKDKPFNKLVMKTLLEFHLCIHMFIY